MVDDTRTTWPNYVVAALVAALLVGVPFAIAQEAALPDTEYTPVAKSTDMWKQVGGARWDNGKLVAGSPTPVDVDFYAVAFRNGRNGFAGGAQCETPPADGLEPEALDAYLETCKRVPVIWAYAPLPGSASPEWHEVYRGDEQGYVGGVAFTADGRALAVGGAATEAGGGEDGVYPVYEHAATEIDPAGEARAWTYNGAAWDPVPESRIPAAPNGPAQGFTAVDCSPRAASLCMVGGFRQLLRWRENRFDVAWSGGDKDATRNSSDLAGAARFRFRVRQLRFWPEKARPPAGWPEAIAVTSGCCDDPATLPRPSVLTFDGRAWKAAAMRNDELTRAGAEAPRTLPDSYYSLRYGLSGRGTGGPRLSILASAGGMAAAADPGAEVTRTSQLFRADPKDNTAVAPFLAMDLATVIIGQDDKYNPTGDLAREATDPRVSAVRLMAGDGDVAGRPGLRSADDAAISDGLIDWAVGEATGGDVGRAVAVTTVKRAADFPFPLRCEQQFTTGLPQYVPKVNTNCPIDPDFASTTKSAMVYALDSHRLNAYDYVEAGGVGWAVGERGAIQQLAGGGSASSGGTARPHKLGAKELSKGPDIEPYRGFRPVLSTEPGVVPPLGARRWQDLSRLELRATGTTDPTLRMDQAVGAPTANLVVTSRGGTQAFALGEIATTTRSSRWNIDHFDGTRWTTCSAEAIPGVLEADPACAGLAGLPSNHGITAAARIPLEVDGDPQNDDEFEVMAVTDGGNGATNEVVVYRDGRWSIDEKLTAQLATVAVRHLAFVAPDDGWLTSRTNEIFHFDGSSWQKCDATNAAKCFDDPARRLLPPTDNGGDTGGPGRLKVMSVGERVYLFGSRSVSAGSIRYFPLILYRDRGGLWTAENGGLDPLGPAVQTAPANQDLEGDVAWLSVARRADGGYVGWAPGTYGKVTSVDGTDEGRWQDGRASALLRLEPGEGGYRWTRWTRDDAVADYLFPRRGTVGNSAGEKVRWARVVTQPDGRAYIAPAIQPDGNAFALYPLLTFTGERWKVLATPFHTTPHAGGTRAPVVRALSTDGAGGAWVAAQETNRTGRFAPATVYYRLNRRHPARVFDEVPHPVREPITSMAAGTDGTVWLSTASSTIYRYDRLAGWDRLQIKGWDPGKVVTRASRANAIAVGPDGVGLVVGDGGRLANLSPKGVILDAAAGLACADDQTTGCGTSEALRAVAISPAGSALAGGDGQALVFRSGAGGDFGPIPSLPGSASASITGIAFPRDDLAWVANDDGQIYRGDLKDGKWTWTLENVTGDGTLLSAVDGGERFAPIHDIDLDADGRGYAVGERGVILERAPGSAQPWRRLRSGYLNNLRSVALPAGSGKGVLIGGDDGLVLTLVDGRFEVAQAPDPFAATQFAGLRDNAARVVGTALLPGSKPGEVEAWVASQLPPTPGRSPAPSALFHYASDGGDPLMDPVRRAQPLPDSPAPRPGEITFAAFGKSDCQLAGGACPELSGTNLAHAAVLDRISEELQRRAGETGGPAFALYTGDMSDEAGSAEGYLRTTPLDADLAHRRWRELVADPLMDAGVPVFAAVGRQDLSNAGACGIGYKQTCSGTREAESGLSTGWRTTFAGMPAPWGSGEAAKGAGGVTFEPVPGQAAATGDTDVTNPSDGSRLTTLPTGGARTHYAFDMVRGGEKVARVVVIDTSHQRSLSVSDSDQNPKEPQRTFVEQMLCTSGPGCTRPEGLPGIVLSNAPTYSFNPGALTETQSDGAALETTLFQQNANLVVSGRLGWNAVYWATAPGVHVPCPGDSARVEPPRPGERPCEAAAAGGGAPAAPAGTPYAPGAEQLAQTLEGLGAPPAPVDLGDATGGVTGALPFVIASGAGGKLAEDVSGKGEGFWHGYSLIRMDPSGDPDLTIVEQRPVFDWVQLTGPDHVLKAGQRMRLTGEGRQPMGIDQPARYVRIDSPSITHRYDLVLADPRRPYLPARDADGDYVELPPGVGSIDRNTGVVTADKGDHGRIFAIAILSVGEKAATYPIAFEPKRSFKPKPARVLPPAPLRPVAQQLLRPLPAPPQPPPPIVLSALPAKLPPLPPAPPPAAPPASLSVELPSPPALPPIGTAPAAPAAAPPAPPAPPAPAAAPPPAALALTLSAPGINVGSQGSVIPPPAPPINPAPPGGARKEARQRQAATAKSESSSDAQGQGGESGGEGGSSAFTRRDAGRHADVAVERHEFTALRGRSEASPWRDGAVYGGGMTLAALLLSMAWTAAGPKARRRQPEVPEPAWVRDERWR